MILNAKMCLLYFFLEFISHLSPKAGTQGRCNVTTDSRVCVTLELSMMNEGNSTAEIQFKVYIYGSPNQFKPHKSRYEV